MTEGAASVTPLHPLRPPERVRVVTAASLFDGHDAAINIMRRILQVEGRRGDPPRPRPLGRGHRPRLRSRRTRTRWRSRRTRAATWSSSPISWSACALRELGAPDVRVYGGGGGTITPEEARRLTRRGRTHLQARRRPRARPRGHDSDDRRRVRRRRCRRRHQRRAGAAVTRRPGRGHAPASRVSRATGRADVEALRFAAPRTAANAAELRRWSASREPAGPESRASSTSWCGRFRLEFPGAQHRSLLVDPTRRRIRWRAARRPHPHERDPRPAHLRAVAGDAAGPPRALPHRVADAVRVLQAAGFDLVIVETAGIGQSDSEIVDLVDLPVYVMTPDYGAPSQLEKIDMLDLAELVVLNKADRQGAEDALRDVRKQWRRNPRSLRTGGRGRAGLLHDRTPLGRPGVDRLYEALRERSPQGRARTRRVRRGAGS